MNFESDNKLGAIKFVFLIFSALASIYLGFFAYSPEQAIQIVKHGGYWLMLLTFVLLLLCLLKFLLIHPVCRRVDWPSLAFVFTMTALLAVMQSSGFKILMDEPVLAATSLQMHEEKEVMTVARAHLIDGKFYLLDAFLDKRPYFFPFLASLLHDLTGYRPLQGALLNLMLTPVLLGLLFSTSAKLGGRVCGYYAVLLCATVPLVSMSVNGAGFDLLNLVMIFAVIRTAMYFSEKPDASGMNLLLLLSVLLVQSRYESALYVLPVGLIILLSWFKARQLRVSWTMVIVPLLLVMVPLQHSVFSAGQHDVWQLKGDAEVPFSLTFVPDNISHALQYFLSLKTEQPNSFLLSVLSILSLFLAPILWHRKSCSSSLLRSPAIISAGLFAVFICASFCLLMAYHWGQLDDVIATRIALPFIALQASFVAIVFANICGRRSFKGLILAGWLCFLFGVTLPKCLHTDFLNRSPISDQAMWLQSKVREHRDANPLFVADLHMIALVERVSTLPSFMAPERKRQIDYHLRRQTYGSILFFYLLEENDSGGLVPPKELAANFSFEVLDQSPMETGQAVQLARLREVKFAPDDTYRLDDDMPDPDSEPEVYFEFFAKSLP